MQQAYSGYVQKILLKQFLRNELQETNLTSCAPTKLAMYKNTVVKAFF